ncbi:MAG TPA: tetratricopeptide repeat protein [Candidatus Angelobacter sp.]|jgi:tetratricopeptide (TPR) repeat protein|nr:tetratricopeptide repeat protein [Candidatus Angelobacter sp.]
MRKAAVLIMVLTATVVAAQAQSSASTPGSPSGPQARTANAGRPPIQTKTREEYKAYQAAIANGQSPEAMEKAADDFAAKFPTSDVRVLLYRAAMSSYQNAGNPEKMMSTGLKVLAIDKDDPEALIGIAEILEERTGPTDLDRQQRSEQVVEYASHALKTLDTDLAVPAGTSPDRVDAYKKYLRSTALAIIGTMYYKQEHFAEAETKLRNAMETDAANPDPVVVLRLALALDQQKKYPDALEQANRAVELTEEGTDLGRMARNERDRLVVKASGSGASAVSAPSENQPAPQTNPPPNQVSPSPASIPAH